MAFSFHCSWSRHIFLLLLQWFLDAFLLLLIIRTIPYTEIDWRTYMQQVRLYMVDGQTAYSALYGDTGPLVYPAAHVYLFAALRYWTNEAVVPAQYIWAVLYLVVLALAMHLYTHHAPAHRAPIIPILLLSASRRIHSLFVLRLFNDCWAQAIVFASMIALIRRHTRIFVTLYSVAVAVKMNVLLYAPAVMVILIYNHGIRKTIGYIAWMAAVQIGIGAQFLKTNPIEYMSRAFQFNRTFTYTWTVNMKMVSEETFVSKEMAGTLLIMHAILLIWFMHRQLPNGLDGLVKRCVSKTHMHMHMPQSLESHTMLTMLFTANLIGITFARSLHYQFYVWYYHTLPWLLWQTRLPTVARLLVLAAIELCWNVYPSTPTTSTLLWVCHLSLLAALAEANAFTRKLNTNISTTRMKKK